MKKHTNTVILWLIAIGLVLGMIITFTPNLGFGGGGVTTQGEVVLRVNGEAITDLQINQLRNANPIYYAVSEGEVGQDLQLLALDAVITQELLRQAAASQRVSNAEVRDAVNAFREDRGLAGSRNDTAYLQLLNNSGFDDASFRNYMREQLRQQKWEAQIVGDVTVSDDEVRTYYEAFRDNYRTDERIVARAITVRDLELANELRNRVLTGESFANLATEHSIERADRAGALGAAPDSTDPQPVGRAVLPAAAASAAFNLRGPGLTSVITANGMYYLVQVEEYIAPEPRPFDEVAETVREDALTSRQVGLVSVELDRLMEEANIEMVDSSEFNYDNHVVARVGDEEIRAADLARITYGNAQVQQFLDPSLSFLITDMLKPQLLDQLIDQTAAHIGAEQLDGEFFGTESQIAQQALNYVARDVDVTEAEIASYYEENLDSYTQNAEAQTVSYEFSTFEDAEAFREEVLSGTTPTDAASLAGVVASDLGTLRPGQSEVAIDAALFNTDAFEPIDDGNREISDVLFIAAPAQESGEDAEDEAAADQGGTAADDDTEAAPLDEVLVDAAEGEVDLNLAAEVQEAAGEAAAQVVDGDDDGSESSDLLDEALTGELAELDEPADRYLVLVADRQEERVRPLEEVRDLVADAVAALERQAIQQEWLESVKAGLEIENLTAAAQDPFGGIDFSPEETVTLPVPEENDAPAEGGDAEEAATDDGDVEEPAADDGDTAQDAADDGDADEGAEDAGDTEEE